MRIVVTIVGEDKVGITARISKLMADNMVNIININQNIMEGFFNMVLVGDMSNATVSLAELKEQANALGAEIGVEVRLQSEDIFTAMHSI